MKLDPLSQTAMEAWIANLETTSYVVESYEDGFKAGTIFQSFHYQVQPPISDRGLISGFLMIWLKRCVVPSIPQDAIAFEVVYLAILRAHEKPLELLPAMVCKLQNGFQELAT